MEAGLFLLVKTRGDGLLMVPIWSSIEVSLQRSEADHPPADGEGEPIMPGFYPGLLYLKPCVALYMIY